MKLTISHSRTKRVIDGAFSICCSLNELEQMKRVITKKIQEGHNYGWVDFTEFISEDGEIYDTIRVQKPIPNKEPEVWD